MPAGDGLHFQIEGLRELVRDLRAMESDLPKQIRRGLKKAAEIVAQEARNRAPVRSGLLKASIKATSGYSTAKVSDTAKRVSKSYPEGYPYPKRIEFGGRGGGAAGPRAFLNPALKAKSDEVERVLDEAVVDLINDHWGRA